MTKTKKTETKEVKNNTSKKNIETNNTKTETKEKLKNLKEDVKKIEKEKVQNRDLKITKFLFLSLLIFSLFLNFYYPLKIQQLKNSYNQTLIQVDKTVKSIVDKNKELYNQNEMLKSDINRLIEENKEGQIAKEKLNRIQSLLQSQ